MTANEPATMKARLIQLRDADDARAPHIAFARDGGQLAVLNGNSLVVSLDMNGTRLWQNVVPQPLQYRRGTPRNASLLWSPCGRRLVAGVYRHHQLFDPSGHRQGDVRAGENAALCWSPGSDAIASADARDIEIRDQRRGEWLRKVRALTGHEMVKALAWPRDDRMIVISNRGAISWWVPRESRVLEQWRLEGMRSRAWLDVCDLRCDGQRLAWIHSPPLEAVQLMLSRTDSGALQQQLPLRTSSASALGVRWSSDGETIAVAWLEAQTVHVRIFCAETESIRCAATVELPEHPDRYWRYYSQLSLDWSFDGRSLAVATGYGQLLLFEVPALPSRISPLPELHGELSKPPIAVISLGDSSHGKTTLLRQISAETHGEMHTSNAFVYETDAHRVLHFDADGALAQTARTAALARRAQLAVLVVDAEQGPGPAHRAHLQAAHAAGLEVVVFLNTPDSTMDEELLAMVELEIRAAAYDHGFDGDDLPFVRGSVNTNREAITALLKQLDLLAARTPQRSQTE